MAKIADNQQFNQKVLVLASVVTAAVIALTGVLFFVTTSLTNIDRVDSSVDEAEEAEETGDEEDVELEGDGSDGAATDPNSEGEADDFVITDPDMLAWDANLNGEQSAGEPEEEYDWDADPEAEYADDVTQAEIDSITLPDDFGETSDDLGEDLNEETLLQLNDQDDIVAYDYEIFGNVYTSDDILALSFAVSVVVVGVGLLLYLKLSRAQVAQGLKADPAKYRRLKLMIFLVIVAALSFGSYRALTQPASAASAATKRRNIANIAVRQWAKYGHLNECYNTDKNGKNYHNWTRKYTKGFSHNGCGDLRAWCSMFVAYVYRQAGVKAAKITEGSKTKLYGAINWKNKAKLIGGEYKVYKKKKGYKPVPGDVAIAQNHVAIYIGKKKGRPMFIGGNQGDKLTYTINFQSKKQIGWFHLTKSDKIPNLKT